MVTLKPFCGLRPKCEFVKQLASPPYDVLDSVEAKKVVENNPLHFLHVTKPEIDLNPTVHMYEDVVYIKGAENLRKLKHNEILVKDIKPCFYIYGQKMGNHQQYGLVAASSIQDYFNQVIKRHERTRADKEDDRTKHIDVTNAQTGPVFLIYKQQQEIDSLVNQIVQEKPVYNFMSDDGITHTLWVVEKDQTIKMIMECFKKLSCTYIADGHHRAASAWRVYEKRRCGLQISGEEAYCYFLTVLFPDNQVQILEYNRVVKDLNGLRKEEFIAKIKEKFDLESTDLRKPIRTTEFTMYIDHSWYKLKAKKGTYPENHCVDSLDVSILQDNLFAPVLGIKNPRIDKRIHFVGGIRGTQELERLVDAGDYYVAFCLFPTTVSQLLAVADQGELMPPKSTWFEPKLRDGVVVYEL